MFIVPPASGALHTQSDSLTLWLWDSLRFAGSYLVWGLMISLMGAAACYCCGYSAYSAYLRRHPPVRTNRRGDVDSALTDEVNRGIAEIEAYLTMAVAPDDPRELG